MLQMITIITSVFFLLLIQGRPAKGFVKSLFYAAYDKIWYFPMLMPLPGFKAN